MIPIDFQVSRSKVKVMLGKGGISVSQTSIFSFISVFLPLQEVCKDTGSTVRICFFNEESQKEAVWHITMATANGVKSLISAVKETWESEFGIDLDINPVTFEQEQM